eukprot:scaffold8140_cov79-Cylindrotheca_fusiformis.AAC.3
MMSKKNHNPKNMKNDDDENRLRQLLLQAGVSIDINEDIMIHSSSKLKSSVAERFLRQLELEGDETASNSKDDVNDKTDNISPTPPPPTTTNSSSNNSSSNNNNHIKDQTFLNHSRSKLEQDLLLANILVGGPLPLPSKTSSQSKRTLSPRLQQDIRRMASSIHSTTRRQTAL